MSSTIDPRAFWTFVKQGVLKWEQTASIVPSSRFLVEAMVGSAAPEHKRTIVELGPGTGVITKPLLSRMGSDAELFTIEIDEPLNNELVRQVDDRRLRAICGSAEHIQELLAEAGCNRKVDAVVSSLGMSLIPSDVRERIAESVAECLAPDGVFVQFGYIHTSVLVMAPGRGYIPFSYRSFLERRFHEVHRRPIALNLPPAWVYESRTPKAARA
jgi:phosphatidylethanolamine/phosphatidyl-N-methylethanolamine N-methyltransferase